MKKYDEYGRLNAGCRRPVDKMARRMSEFAQRRRSLPTDSREKKKDLWLATCSEQIKKKLFRKIRETQIFFASRKKMTIKNNTNNKLIA